jgi:hypothetical protein
MKFLFNDLHLKKNKDVLEKLFDKEVPRTTNDVIVFFVKVIGEIDGILQEKTYLKKYMAMKNLVQFRGRQRQGYVAYWICILMEE